MAATLDISDDYTIFDNAEAVTVTLKRSGEDCKVGIANGLRGVVSRREANAAGIDLTTDTASWFIPHDQLTASKKSHRVRERDIVTDGDEIQWIVQSVSQVAMGGSTSGWQCVCVKAVV